MAARIIFVLLAISATVSAQGNSDCARWCAANFPDPGSQCTSLAAQGGGPCYTCGPLKKSSTEQLCSGACRETSTDNQNCGTCGTVCPSGTACSSGKCLCTNSGLSQCNGKCPDYQTDRSNCGKCGIPCPTGSSCSSGSCVDACDISYNPSGEGLGNTVLTPGGVASARDCCLLCRNTPDCVASAFPGSCQLLVKIVPLVGAPTGPTCPLGIENYNFLPGPGVVYVGPCASPPRA